MRPLGRPGLVNRRRDVALIRRDALSVANAWRTGIHFGRVRGGRFGFGLARRTLS